MPASTPRTLTRPQPQESTAPPISHANYVQLLARIRQLESSAAQLPKRTPVPAPASGSSASAAIDLSDRPDVRPTPRLLSHAGNANPTGRFAPLNVPRPGDQARLDSTLLALLTNDTFLVANIDEQTYREALTAEFSFLAPLSFSECAHFAQQLSDAIAAVAPRSAVANAYYSRGDHLTATDPLSLRDTWLEVIKEFLPQFDQLVLRAAALNSVTSRSTPFLNSVRAACHRRLHQQPAQPAKRPSPTAANTIPLAYSATPPPKAPRRSLSFSQSPGSSFSTTALASPASALGTPSPTTATPPATASATATEAPKPLPPLALNRDNLQHAENIRKAQFDFLKLGERSQDWVCNSFGADPTDIRALLKGDPKTRQWFAAELKGVCQGIVTLFEATETRVATADALSQEARDKLIQRESAMQSRIRVSLQIMQLGEERSGGFRKQVRAASAKDDLVREFGEKGFSSFMREFKKAKNNERQHRSPAVSRRDRKSTGRDQDRARFDGQPRRDNYHSSYYRRGGSRYRDDRNNGRGRYTDSPPRRDDVDRDDRNRSRRSGSRSDNDRKRSGKKRS